MLADPPKQGAVSGSDRVDITAPGMVSVLVTQVGSLRGLTAGLEEALSSSLCSCSPLSEEAFVTFQRIDYMRQALKDIEGLLSQVGPNLNWSDPDAITWEALASSVDMEDSIQGFAKEGSPPILRDKPKVEPDAGEPDLW
ncbi:hypothetical protein [Pseudooceanicola algae]|uniref:Uncharacterized protein n=1 Tax=Pseudooceanicola algae TaxID=1537215 RepID=A0A418SEA0_9RHOB|nr:hypothetical protein [Pseudooceanicola algae]QPM89582.1 hypothetical protein PSAL_008030 [Pseudooceanicola algae]